MQKENRKDGKKPPLPGSRALVTTKLAPLRVAHTPPLEVSGFESLLQEVRAMSNLAKDVITEAKESIGSVHASADNAEQLAKTEVEQMRDVCLDRLKSLLGSIASREQSVSDRLEASVATITKHIGEANAVCAAAEESVKSQCQYAREEITRRLELVGKKLGEAISEVQAAAEPVQCSFESTEVERLRQALSAFGEVNVPTVTEDPKAICDVSQLQTEYDQKAKEEPKPEPTPARIAASALKELGALCMQDEIEKEPTEMVLDVVRPQIGRREDRGLHRGVEVDPELRDYCEWRKAVLQRKKKHHAEETGDSPLQRALEFGDSAVERLSGAGLSHSPEAQRIEDMKARLVIHSYAEAGLEGKRSLWPAF